MKGFEKYEVHYDEIAAQCYIPNSFNSRKPFRQPKSKVTLNTLPDIQL